MALLEGDMTAKGECITDHTVIGIVKILWRMMRTGSRKWGLLGDGLKYKKWGDGVHRGYRLQD